MKTGWNMTGETALSSRLNRSPTVPENCVGYDKIESSFGKQAESQDSHSLEMSFKIHLCQVKSINCPTFGM